MSNFFMGPDYTSSLNRFMPYSGNYSGIDDGLQWLYDILNYIAKHPLELGTFIVCIPIFSLMLWAFIPKKKNERLGFTSLFLLLVIIFLAYIYKNKMGDPGHYGLLIVLAIVSFSFMVYFAKKQGQPVKDDMYIEFYTPDLYKKNEKNPLSYYGLGKNKDSVLELMKGNEYSFALKESMPMDLGTEFTYSFWLKVCPNNFNSLNTNWRTVWYRGETADTLYKMKTPGVYLAPNTNKLIISVACENGPDEGNAITIDYIPINEWFCVTVTLEGRALDVYINGLLEYSMSLTGTPLMMNSNVIKGRNGFNGLMAFFRYSSASWLPADIKNMYDRERATLEESSFDLETCPTES